MAASPSSGVSAERPSQFGWPAWRDVTKRAAGEVKKDNLSIVAAGVAFYVFLALFPAIAAGVSIYGMVADPAEVQKLVSGAQGLLPPQAAEIISQQMSKIAASSGSALGIGAIIGVLLAIWSATKGTKALIEALNITYEEEERRSFFRLNGVALLLTLAVIISLLVAVALVAVLPALLGKIGLPSVVQTAIDWARWPLLALFMMVGLAIFFRYAPSRQAPRFQWVSYGAVIATLLWLVASGLFSWYVSNSGSYNETYGSIAAIVILLMWLYISAFVVLFGAELNSEMERQTARDTTTGQPLPMGRREAVVADTVAAEPQPASASKARRERRPSAPPPTERPQTIPEIEGQIENTRRSIHSTASALGARFSMDRPVDNLLSSLRAEKTDGELRERPLLLGALGAATGAILAASLARRTHNGQAGPGRESH